MRTSSAALTFLFFISLHGRAEAQRVASDSGFLSIILTSTDTAFVSWLPGGLLLRLERESFSGDKTLAWIMTVNDPRRPNLRSLLEPKMPPHGPYVADFYAWSARSKFFPDMRFFSVGKPPIEIIARLRDYTTEGDSSNFWFTAGVLEIRWYQRAPGNYPPHWWEPVAREGAPAWEILPQEAAPGEVILSKRHELGLLSNFAATSFTFRGKRYASLEGFWQMMLYPENNKDPRATFPGVHWANTREQVARLVSFEAKKAGELAEENMKTMGIDWVSFEGKRFEFRPREPGEHYRLIVAATWEKVGQNPKVKKVLLSTGDLVLRPDHHQEPNAPAAWRYFEILTEIRSRLQQEKH